MLQKCAVFTSCILVNCSFVLGLDLVHIKASNKSPTGYTEIRIYSIVFTAKEKVDLLKL